MPDRQLLHLVFGGELENLEEVKFRDLSNIDFVGIFPNYVMALVPVGIPAEAPKPRKKPLEEILHWEKY